MGKKTLFLDPQTGDHTMSYMGSKVPGIRKSGDEKKDYQTGLKRSAYIKLVSLCWNHPELIGPLKDHLDDLIESNNRASASNQASPGTSGRKPNAAITVRNLLEDWCVSWLLAKAGVEQKVLEKMKSYDSEIVRQLLVYGLATMMGLKLPVVCADMEVTCEAFDTRYELVGKRIERLMKTEGAVDKGSGAIKWGRFGVYSLQWGEGGFAAKVQHNPTETSCDVPESVYITKKYSILNNWGDFNAVLELKPNVYKLHEFFGKQAGPHSYPTWKTDNKDLNAAIKAAESAVEKGRKAMASKQLKAQPNFMEEQKKLKAMEAAERARSALKNRMQVLNDKRKHSVDE